MKALIKSVLKPILIRTIIFFKYDIKKIPLAVKYAVRILSQRTSSRRVYIFGAPYHTNLGDQAQTYCIENWIRSNLADSEIITMQDVFDLDILLLFLISLTVKSKDVGFCHSGYHFSERYPQYKYYMWVVRFLRKIPVVVFPQTVNFKDMKNAISVADIFDMHPNCTLMCRDEHSYYLAKKIFKKTKLLKYPDIVTSLIGMYDFMLNERDGILFCIRNDSESYYSRSSISEYMKCFSPMKTTLYDTYADIKYSDLVKNISNTLNKTFEDFSRYKLVITDRYHGTIFSLISNTPVIVLGTQDHKLESGVKWFSSKEFEKYIYFAQNLEDAYSMAKIILRNPPTGRLPKYFADKYYNVLLDKLSI